MDDEINDGIEIEISVPLPGQIRIMYQIACTLNSLYVHSADIEPEARKSQHDFVISLFEMLMHSTLEALGICTDTSPDHMVEHIVSMRQSAIMTKRDTGTVMGPEYVRAMDKKFSEMMEEIAQ